MSPGRHPFEPLQLLTWTLLPIPALSFPSSSAQPQPLPISRTPTPFPAHLPIPPQRGGLTLAHLPMPPQRGGLTPDPAPSVLLTVKPKSLSSFPAQLSQPSPIKQAQCWSLLFHACLKRSWSKGPFQYLGRQVRTPVTLKRDVTHIPSVTSKGGWRGLPSAPPDPV